MYREIILFVEGADDRRFAASILLPLAGLIFDNVRVYEYSEQKPTKVSKYLNAIKNIGNWSYLFVADFDEGPCITLRKSRLTDKYNSLEEKRILIVRREIESWYMAGLDSNCCNELNIPDFIDAHSISKEQF